MPLTNRCGWSDETTNSDSTDSGVLLLGGGGHGAVVLDALLSGNVRVTGVLDPSLKPGCAVLGVPVLGDDSYLETIDRERHRLANGLGANPTIRQRRELFLRLTGAGFSFLTIRHTTAIVGREVRIGSGAQLMAGSVVQPRVRIGRNAVVNTRSVVEHDVVLGPHAFLGPGAILCGHVRVGRSGFVGAGATVLPGIHIGSHAIVGAGAVVADDVPDGWVVAGSPARRMGTAS
jgi:UDP-perosamine 4-acetyltransferase